MFFYCMLADNMSFEFSALVQISELKRTNYLWTWTGNREPLRGLDFALITMTAWVVLSSWAELLSYLSEWYENEYALEAGERKKYLPLKRQTGICIQSLKNILDFLPSWHMENHTFLLFQVRQCHITQFDPKKCEQVGSVSFWSRSIIYQVSVRCCSVVVILEAYVGRWPPSVGDSQWL